MAGATVEDAPTLESALDAECWASSASAVWSAKSPLMQVDPEELFGLGLIAALERIADAPAMAALRALSAGGSRQVAEASREAAERLAARDLAEPAWAADLGTARPTEARIMSETAFDDGVSVLVGFEGPGEDDHVVGAYIDHNLGGMAKDLLLVPGPLAKVVEVARVGGELEGAIGGAEIRIEPLALELAAARIRAALELTEMTLGPPLGEDFHALRSLLDARLRLLPEGGEVPEVPEVSAAERDSLLEAFLRSREGRRFREDEDAADMASLAIGFCADYLDGRPLRWSPAVVEIFMLDWLPRKVLREPEFFERVPEVLPAWIRYAGRRRRTPTEAVELTASSVTEWGDDLLEAVLDEDRWDPAKEFAMAAQEAGIDLGDEAQVQAFVERYNAELGQSKAA